MKTKALYGAVLALAMVLASCGESKKETLTERLVVRVDTVGPADAGSVLQYPGRLVPAAEVKASFKVAGTLKRVLVKEGDHVRAGQLLAEMDATDYEVQLSATEAEYAQIKAEAERVIGLYGENATTASNYDKARYGLQQIEAKLQHHRNQVAYTRLTATMDGYVQHCYFHGGETVAAGMPVVSLLSSGALEVEVNLPATSYLHREDFSTFSCTLDVMPDTTLPLQLVNILPKANANQLYTMRLRLSASAEQKDAANRLAAGMSCWVSICTSESAQTQVRIPATALCGKDGKSYIYLYAPKTGLVHCTEVNVCDLHGDGTVVVQGDVHVGDLVVATGAHHLKDGDQVQLLPPVSKTNIGGLL